MTMKELLEFDPDPVESGEYLRFACPLRSCEDKPNDRLHKSLSVKGALWHCFRCSERGLLTDVVKSVRVSNKNDPPSWWSSLK